MNFFIVLFTFCCISLSYAFPGLHGGSEQLQAVPDASGFEKLQYPKFDIIELGSAIKGHLPPTIVHINKQVIHKVPQPYPVKVPYPVPHPVPVAKPYPVVQTKIIKVPQPIPVEIIKKVPYPIEVPKPYPVPHEEFAKGAQGQFGGGFGGHSQISESQNQGGYGGGFEGGHGDQSGAYDTSFQTQEGFVPIQSNQEHQELEQSEEQHST